MKATITTLAILVSTAMAAEAPDPWIVAPPQSVAAEKKVVVPTGDVFEVVASMAARAASDLSMKTLVAISDEQARKFTGHYYSCPQGKRPFLVRAAFGFAGTGRFRVERVGDALWIMHESLGDEFVSSRTALVVNLDFQPDMTYATVSIIR